MNPSIILDVQNLHVHFQDKVILDNLTFSLPSKGVFALMGPGGAGKSTLLRTLCTAPKDHVFSVQGLVEYSGEGLPSWIPQHLALKIMSVHEFMASHIKDRHTLTKSEQVTLLTKHLNQLGLGELVGHFQDELHDLKPVKRRLLVLAAQLLEDPALLCIDEPLLDLETKQAEQVLTILKREGERRAILWVSHHLSHVRQWSNHVSLLASGQWIESAPVEQFFCQPQQETTRTYIKTGNCMVNSPDVSHEELEPSYQPEDLPEDLPPQVRPHPLEPKRSFASRSVGPSNFHWVVSGRLAGCAQPGLMETFKRDFEALKRTGCTVLVTLTENRLEQTPDDVGIHTLMFSIEDMKAPEIKRAATMCARIQGLLLQDHTVVFHCKAGKGRTGTMLAAMLIWNGVDANEALIRVRRASSMYVQSQEQEEFLRQFGDSEWIPST